MTDRELLELAAKAAGIETEWKRCAANSNDYDLTGISGPFVNNRGWNPLTDDGDALRLAVKLNVHLKQVAAPDGKKAVSAGYAVNEIRMDYIYENIDDLYAATRRAIVRSAAEIGKSML